MLIFLGRNLLVFSLLSVFIFASEDIERICEEEILKEDFNVSIVEDAYFETAKAYYWSAFILSGLNKQKRKP